MAKSIILDFEGAQSSFEHTKLDRAQLYGSRRRIPLDPEDQVCIRASLTVDGLYLLQSGMTAQGYFDEQGKWLQRSQLVGLDSDGNKLDVKPSTLGIAQKATAINPSELLRYTVNAIYILEPITLDSALASRMESGAVVRFGFNYGTDYHLETGFLVKNSEGYFCLVGEPITASWSEPGRIESIVTTEDSPDDLDFEMF